MKRIKSALISVFYKENLDNIVKILAEHEVEIYSTGGTQKFIEEQGASVIAVEDLTSYPSILGGRVKTLHPKVFGGILNRRDNEGDQQQISEYQIPNIDLVIVDLYPFEETVASGAEEADIIEKIDIGGISLIRAAAKNFKDVVIISSREQYGDLEKILSSNECSTSLSHRRRFATQAFEISSHYDTAIFNYFNLEEGLKVHKSSVRNAKTLRYGENPHQEGVFFGNLDDLLEQLHGKEISYNNLVDIDAAIRLIEEFIGETAFAILKHNNACGVALGETVKEAYLSALEADNISAFGGVLITNKTIDLEAAKEINKLFCEVVIAPEFRPQALDFLKSKKNRVLLVLKGRIGDQKMIKTLLNGIIEQDSDFATDQLEGLKDVTTRKTTQEEKDELLFASKICKHTKSNTIVLTKGKQMLASGVGQTSRVDALYQAIDKAKKFGFDLNGAVMASDAFFPFPDCVEIASKEGIKTVIQPGGSIKDKDSIDFCNTNGVAMVFTGTRHFKH